ncbi:FAD-binding FR-type domain-containing protein [Mycena indigotica]|uniref:NADH-cytochrome b5 reductase n=1 Tax=Mycena indigotica TaxID=2126181 RepID=A0A8H6W454_9AGAR|nr:FAD-binding FR-type domain-containing protein [Mycena indigotica]KAF7302206.1 FAD-binding FR-type domain-containing protein [Mycena indigotica]
MHKGATFALATAVGVVGAVAYSKTSKTPFSVIGPLSLTRMTLQSSELLNHNTKKLRFALPDSNTRTGLSLTSALLSVSLPPGNGLRTPVLRPYTPTNDPNEPGYVEFMIKLYPGGKQSTLMHSLKPGDTLSFMRIPSLGWKPNQYEHVALIAGGAGITPMYQLLHGILSNPDDKTRITLVWGVNTDEDLFLKEEFAALEKSHPQRFKTHYVVSNPEQGSRFKKGYVTKELLEQAGLKADNNGAVKVLVCGPPPMEKALTARGSGILAQLGYSASQIHQY